VGILPPVFGFYLGSRRLGALMLASMAGRGLTALIVHATGMGNTSSSCLPPMTRAHRS
jgi:hypothetical protein